MKITAVNSSDRDWTKHRYLIGFGAYGWTVLMVWADSLDDAMDECADWCDIHAPGLLCDDEVKEEYNRVYPLALLENGGDEEKAREVAWEQSEVDTISCDGGHYFHSWEVNLLSKDPTRDDILNYLGNPPKARQLRIEKAKRTGRPFPKHKSSRVKLLTVCSNVDKV